MSLKKKFCSVSSWRSALSLFVDTFTEAIDGCKGAIRITGDVGLDLGDDPLTVKHECETVIQTGFFKDVTIQDVITEGKRRVKIQNIGIAVGTVTYFGQTVSLAIGGVFDPAQFIEACEKTTIFKTAEVKYDATGTTFRILVID